MSLLFFELIKKKEILPATFTKGIPNETESPITTFTGKVTPFNGKSAQVQTEGIFTSQVVSIFSEERLKIPIPNKNEKGTYVLFHGNWYECMTEKDRSEADESFSDLSYYKYTGMWRSFE